MKLSGGNYGGYEVVDDEAILTVDGEVVESIEVVLGEGMVTINGWVYNEEGIFVGME